MTEQEKIRLGKTLKDLRVSKDMTLEYVAEQLGITHKSVQFWEQGKNEIKLSKLIILAKLYGTSIDDILDQSNI
ncbi:helix-turn-helix domain-containing protein [Erysipelothrix anatis]|uniref:helix-turn-helix domain-containing protein n=1 Tax=Erysipelothrix anatis TaxID=2683713 RepID=UPI0013590C35|nr:helix-turn-helix transcriptional regulator [Erysipelothrix anatis]